MLDRIVEAGLKPPQTLTLAITNGCNLLCRHCWPESLSKSISAAVSGKILGRLIDEFADLGIERINITGGEPLTHPEWLEILAWCCKQPNVIRVCLQTNATLLHEAQARQLAALQGAAVSIQVSLEGATAESHEWVRGKGSFQAALAGLRHLVACGLGPQTIVALTEMEHNFDELPLLLEIIEDLGLGGLVASTLMRSGRAAGTDHLTPPVPSQYRELLRRYHADSGFRQRYDKRGKIAALEWYKSRKLDHAGDGCACCESLYVTADGRLYPCALFQAEEFVIENIHERSLQEVLPEALAVWRRIPAMIRRRSRELAACRGCAGRPHCRGGCMGRAYAAHGSAMTVEDRCGLRRAVYSYENGD